MSQFHQEDFRDSIDDMCDGALRRMHAFYGGDLGAMQDNDHFYSEIIARDSELEVVEYDTQTKASIVDSIHGDVVECEILPDYTLDILSGAMIALARHAAFRSRHSDVLVPTNDAARSYVSEKILLGGRVIAEKKPLKLLSYELGAASMTSLVIGPNHDDWELYYDAHHRVALIRW